MKKLFAILFAAVVCWSVVYAGIKNIGDPREIGPNPIFNESVSAAISNTLSVAFDGVNDYVNIPDHSSLDIQNNLTVSVWLKGTGRQFDAAVSRYEGIAGKNLWFIRKPFTPSPYNLIEVNLYDGTNIQKLYKSSAIFFDGTWKHFAFTFASNVLKIYVNGAEDTGVDKAQDGTLNSWPSTSMNHAIGSMVNGASSPYVGNIDEVSIWNAELSAAQIAEIYNSGVPTNLNAHSASANLQGWWRMGDGDTFLTLIDNSSNTNNGTMTNMDAGDIVADVP